MYQFEHRFNNKCKSCGAFFTVLAVPDKDDLGKEAYRDVGVANGAFFPPSPRDSYRVLYTCACGQKRGAKAVVGKLNRNIKCNAKCTSATGHQCECSCGGKNHGAH